MYVWVIYLTHGGVTPGAVRNSDPMVLTELASWCILLQHLI